jgi:hypothetical protein
MFKILRRWHFDVALILGLVAFGSAVYLSQPQPLWSLPTSPQAQLNTSNFMFLGFHENDSYLYTCKNIVLDSKQLALPTIQVWETNTGKLLDTYPFQIPEVDQHKIKQYGKHVRIFFWPTGQQNLVYSMIQFEAEDNNSIFRLYQLQDGTCLGDTYVSRRDNDTFNYLMQNPDDGHHLGVVVKRKNDGQAIITDLSDGKKLHSFAIPGDHFYKAMITPSSQFLIFVFLPSGQQPYLQVYRMHSWEFLGRFDLPPGYHQQMTFLNDAEWLVKNLLNNEQGTYDRQRFEVLRFDLKAKKLSTLQEHPIHGREFKHYATTLFLGQQVYSLTFSVPLSSYYPFLLPIESWLERYVYKRPKKMSLRVYDIHDGHLCRQLSDLPVSDLPEGSYTLSNHAHFLAYVEREMIDKKPEQQIVFSLYAVPHYLWELTLSRMKWLCWLFIIAWPFRYLIRPANPQMSPMVAPT